MLDAKLRLIEVTSPPGPLHCDLIHCLTEPTGLRSADFHPREGSAHDAAVR